MIDAVPEDLRAWVDGYLRHYWARKRALARYRRQNNAL